MYFPMIIDKKNVFLYYIRMENILKKVLLLEEKITRSIDLLEIAKDYCSANFDKGREVSAIGTILDVVLDTQLELADELDDIA